MKFSFKKTPHKAHTANVLELFEDILLEANIASAIVDEIISILKKSKPADSHAAQSIVKELIINIIRSQELIPSKEEKKCWLLLGVTGVGKTTTAAKLASYWKKRGQRVTIAAGDTFRAAAVEQLAIHAEKLGIRCIKQKQGADPASVIFDAIESVHSSKGGLVIADSAGRMHTKTQLVQELVKIDKIIQSKIKAEHYKKILVLDATTGNNAVQQAEIFHQALSLDGIILSKYDSGAQAGFILSISKTLRIPFVMIGTGEEYESIIPFDSSLIARNILKSLS